jgi:hypothetical protein
MSTQALASHGPLKRPAPAVAAGRRMLCLIAGLLALPFVVAALMWQFGWQPGRTGHHGELLAGAGMPARMLQEGQLQALGPGQAAAPLLGHWLLALAVPAECDAACMAQLDLARRVQVSLNKDMVRLKRAVVGPQLHDAGAIGVALQRWPDLRVARLAAAAWPGLQSADGLPHLVLIDPQGRLVLRYPAAPDARLMRRDLERLLKYSWLG